MYFHKMSIQKVQKYCDGFSLMKKYFLDTITKNLHYDSVILHAHRLSSQTNNLTPV